MPPLSRTDDPAPAGSKPVDAETRYRERLHRYVTAMRNEVPDRVPIRPFVAEFTGRHAGVSCQALAHDYMAAFQAARRCAIDYDWDAVVPNMVYVWTGLTQALGLRYYGIPGIDFDLEMGFQYREPPPDAAFMRPEEYDDLIADPTRFLLDVWLPRVSTELSPIGHPTTTRHNLALVKGGMAMMQYFQAFGPQIEALRTESGTVSAIAGIFKAPMDILADKLRGYLGLVDDLVERPDKVFAACEALAPHLAHVGRITADPERLRPIGFWMHRGGVPFVSPKVFREIYWATLRPIIEQFWADGHQTLFYAEGNWDRHLESFAELPERSIVYHVDRGNMERTHDVLGSKFCLSGGVSNTLLAHGSAEEVRAETRRLIEIAGRDGGFIVDASAIVQNDAEPANLMAMTQAARDFGQYDGIAPRTDAPAIPAAEHWSDGSSPPRPKPAGADALAPGVCYPWAAKRTTLPAKLSGDPRLLERVWEDVDALAYTFIYQVLLSF